LQGSPKKIVIFGGGGGINSIIQGLKDLYDITAVVSVFDDGGSTGQLRNHSGIAVGDFRNALTAMARWDENKAIVDVLNYRFKRNDIGAFFSSARDILNAALDEMNYDDYSRERVVRVFEERFGNCNVGLDEAMNIPVTTNGHPVGNLILCYLIMKLKDDEKWIESANHIFGSHGRVLPNTTESCRLIAFFDGYQSVVGESYFDNPSLRIPPIIEITLDRVVKAYNGVLGAVKQADLVVIAPGSFYASIIASLLPDGIKKALEGKRILWFGNFFYDLNQTLYRIPKGDGEEIILITPEDQVEILVRYLGKKPDLVIVQDPERFPKDPDILERYKNELGLEEIMPDYTRACIEVYPTDLARLDYTQMKRGPGYVFRHDPEKVRKSFRDVLAKYNL
jgi:uncharacterized cofD-like protein